MRAIAVGLLIVLCGTSAPAEERRPILDIHVHAFGFDQFGDPPPPNPVTGRRPEARTDEAAMQATLRELDRLGIVAAYASGPLEDVLRWRAAAPGRVVGGAFTIPGAPLPEPTRLRELFRTGELGMLGELGLQYLGLSADDPALDPYFALAEELDVPVGIHTGLSFPGTPYQCCPAFRTKLGRPGLIEEVLVRHPRLRVFLMHAGWPWLEETKAILALYPQVHADLSVIDWILPRAEFHAHLRALVEAGFAGRLMFGSDQMVWPEAIAMAIEGIESATFLTPEQKRAIFYDNAARFLRLTPEQIAAHHRK
ncbi:MAG: amidohydrolase [Thermoanaerobaculia bacterium]|nr:MAG: amidohydrolase [Thermoanaerobaculia bacterium]